MKVADVIRQLQLEPLAGEGGFFRRTYESRVTVGTPRGERLCATAIYYLVTPDSFSALHRLPQDELFHFYLGSPCEMVQIDDSGSLRRLVLGSDLLNGEQVQVLAPGNVWQGTRLLKGEWALLGATVVPGFDYADFELGVRAALVAKYPHHADVIRRFTSEPA